MVLVVEPVFELSVGGFVLVAIEEVRDNVCGLGDRLRRILIVAFYTVLLCYDLSINASGVVGLQHVHDPLGRCQNLVRRPICDLYKRRAKK